MNAMVATLHGAGSKTRVAHWHKLQVLRLCTLCTSCASHGPVSAMSCCRVPEPQVCQGV